MRYSILPFLIIFLPLLVMAEGITVTSPTIDTDIYSNSDIKITWESETEFGLVRISYEYEENGETKSYAITTNPMTVNEGCFKWRVPSYNLPNDGLVRIKVSEAGNKSFFGYSELIEIQPCEINVNFEVPNGVICPGNTINFTNTSTGGENYEWFWNGNSIGKTRDLELKITSTTFQVALMVSNDRCRDLLLKLPVGAREDNCKDQWENNAVEQMVIMDKVVTNPCGN